MQQGIYIPKGRRLCRGCFLPVKSILKSLKDSFFLLEQWLTHKTGLVWNRFSPLIKISKITTVIIYSWCLQAVWQYYFLLNRSGYKTILLYFPFRFCLEEWFWFHSCAIKSCPTPRCTIIYGALQSKVSKELLLNLCVNWFVRLLTVNYLFINYFRRS